MQVNGPQLNPGATNLYSAVEIKKPAEVGQTLSSGGTEGELQVDDVFRISSEVEQDSGQSTDQGAPERQNKRAADAGAGTQKEDPPPEERPEDPRSFWG